jgi:hypothetical protein
MLLTAIPLYRRILGQRFEQLPDVLQRFHGALLGGRARGQFTVTRGSSFLKAFLADLLRLPKAGTQVPVRLEVQVERDRERWVRQFGDRTVETVQWAEGNLLMEAFGTTTFLSELIIDGLTMRYEFLRAWQWGIPLPRWLAPQVQGSVTARETTWWVDVRISTPWVGELVHYQGWVEPE